MTVQLFEGNQKVKLVGSLDRDIDLYDVRGECVGSDFISAKSEPRYDTER
jgi:hypothetical protein